MSNPVGGGTREPDEQDRAIPPGEYLLALVWFVRRTSQAGNSYLRCRFIVCTGPQKGRGFFCPWGLDTSKPGCLKRWELWMEQIGQKDEVDLDDDREIARAFKGAPFKAEVKRTSHGGYENNDIDRLIYSRLYGKIDWQNISDWKKEWAERGWEGRDPSDPGPAGADRPPPPSDPQWSEGSSFKDDDDDVSF